MKKFLDINDVTICVDDTESDKKAILLFHGSTRNKESMYSLRDNLKDDYRVICVDTRGHGESTHPSSYTLEDHAKDAHEIIKQLNLGKVDILGYSMGSYIALKTAQLNCENIDHLILVCSKPSGNGSAIIRFLKEANLDITTISPEETMKLMLKATLSPNTIKKIQNFEFDLSEFNYVEGVELTDEEKLIENESLKDFDNSKDYDKVTCKTLVISAEHDVINPPELGKQIADGIQNAKYVLIKDAGHGLSFEKPEEYLETIKNFLNETV